MVDSTETPVGKGEWKWIKIVDPNLDYKYEITSSNYNPSNGSNVTISVKVTVDSLPIGSHSFVLNANGTNVNLTTNSNGIATYTYTCNSFGLCRFSVGTYDCFINIIKEPYPIGAVYISFNNTSPATLFGGTWEQLTDSFLYASTSADTNSTTATAGSKDAVVVSHNHTQNAHSHGTGDSAKANFVTSNGNVAANGTKRSPGTANSNGYNWVYTSGATIGQRTATQSVTPTNNATGVDGTDKNMPPYMKVYMWKRTG